MTNSFIYLAVAFMAWVTFGAAFGAAGDLGTDATVSSSQFRMVFIYAPIITLLWPLWVYILMWIRGLLTKFFGRPAQ